MDSCVTVRALAMQTLSQFILDSAVYQVRPVEVDGRPASFRLEREKLIVTPAKDLPRGREFTVAVRFTSDRT
jgi:aminopeptidase N